MSDDALPDPLVPPEVDLRDFPFTPLYRARLFGSSFHARTSDAEWRAGVTLWLKSWDQVPAGTLPDDDIDLCRLSELGRNLKTWRKVKDGALHGWVKTSDGRLHHGVVAEGVLAAWGRRSKASVKGKAGASKRWGTGNARAIDDQMPAPSNLDSTGIAQAMPGDSKGQGQGRDREETARHLPPSMLPRDGPGPIPEHLRRASSKPRDAAKPAQSAAPLVSQQATEIIAAFDRACKAAWPDNHRAFPAATDAVIAMRWAEAGVDASLVEAAASAVFKRRAAKGGTCPSGLGYLDGAIAEVLTARHGKGSSGNGAKPAPYRSPYTDAEREAMRLEDAAFEAAKAGTAP